MRFYFGPAYHVYSDHQIRGFRVAGTLSAAECVFFLVQLEQLKGFQFGPDFHVTSDPQIRGFIVVLRAAEWFFILVLLFMYLQISRIRKFCRRIEYR